MCSCCGCGLLTDPLEVQRPARNKTGTRRHPTLRPFSFKCKYRLLYHGVVHKYRQGVCCLLHTTAAVRQYCSSIGIAGSRERKYLLVRAPRQENLARPCSERPVRISASHAWVPTLHLVVSRPRHEYALQNSSVRLRRAVDWFGRDAGRNPE